MNHSTHRLNRLGLAFGAIYLLLVATASVLAILRPGDGDGLAWVPVGLLAAPWSLLGVFFGPEGVRWPLFMVPAGIALNAALAYWLGSRLGRARGT